MLNLCDEFTLDLTQKDIDDGVPGSHCRCPVAHLLTRTLPGNYCIYVSPRFVRISTEFKFYIFSHDAEDFIRKFDFKEKVEPRKVTFKREY